MPPLYSKNKPFVSIIVTVYNVEKYLPVCLNSILKQTLTNIEIIVIDDHSTDGSWEMVQQYAGKDDRFVIMRHEKNNGNPSYARNAGIQKARGKYVTFVDADDYIAPTFLENCCRKAEQKNCDIAYGTMAELDDHTQKIIRPKSFYKHKNQSDGSRFFNYQNVSADFWKHFNTAACAKMYNRNFLIQEKLSFWEVPTEDMFFSLQTFTLARKIVYVEASRHKNLYIYRLNKVYGENRDRVLNSDYTTRYIECLYEINQWLRERKIEITEPFLYVMYRQIKITMENRLTPPQIPEYLKKSRAFLRKISTAPSATYVYFDALQKEDIRNLIRYKPIKYLYYLKNPKRAYKYSYGSLWNLMKRIVKRFLYFCRSVFLKKQ